jgi:SAM-dependent methyltransferase
VAADANRLPFVDGLFDTATMIRVLHHMVDAPGALGQVQKVLGAGGVLILEFANKLNLKAILRYLSGRQKWSPFAPGPVEFAPLNFDFHPRSVRDWLEGLGFKVERILAVSHFRIAFLKRVIPVAVLTAMDSALQWTGGLWQLTPSVFLRARLVGEVPERSRSRSNASGYFKCPECGHTGLQDKGDHLLCRNCQRRWAVSQGIYDFREPLR